MRQATCALLVLGLILLGPPAGAQMPTMPTTMKGVDPGSLSRDLATRSEGKPAPKPAGSGGAKAPVTTTGGDTGRAYVSPEGKMASADTLKQVEDAARYLEKQGQSQEAARVRALAEAGKIRLTTDPAQGGPAGQGQVKGDYIYLNEGKSGGAADMAQALIGHMERQTQSDTYVGGSKMWGNVGGNPSEVDANEKVIQIVDNWITAKENSLQHETNPKKREQIIEEIKGLLIDNRNNVQVVKGNGYEGVLNDLEIYTRGKEHDSAAYLECLQERMEEYGAVEPSGGQEFLGPSGGTTGVPAHCFPPMPPPFTPPAPPVPMGCRSHCSPCFRGFQPLSMSLSCPGVILDILATKAR